MSSDRFRLVDSAPALPGCCLLCSGHNGPFIDTSLSLMGKGAVYLCKQCITEMYNEIPQPVVEEEKPPPPTPEEIEAAVAKAKVDLDDFLNDYVERVRTIDLGDLFPAVVVGSKDTKQDAGKKGGGRTRASKSNKQVDSAASEQGPADVPSDSSDGLDFDFLGDGAS